jgi:aryl-alcohol dehydrogenase-like predicted oxidoreductase
MEYRTLGRSGLHVSRIALGTMTFGGRDVFAKVGATMHEDARRQIGTALDAGVNLIDTADMYSGGLSEEIVGAAVKGFRDDVLLASKVRFPMGDGPNDAGLSRHHIIRGCEGSLRRLGTDHLDLYQLHEWDGLTPVEEMASALDHLVSAGKVRYVGVSNFSAWHVMKLIAATERLGTPRIASQQLHYTLQAREAEYELLPLSLDQGLGVLVWSPLAGGLLSGKYRRGVQPEGASRVLAEWGEPPVHDEGHLYDIVDVLVAVADAHGVSAAQVAIAWLLSREAVTGVVIGARTDAQLADNLAAADLRLDGAELARLEQVSRPRLLYPYWHQAAEAADRLSAADLSLLRPYLS